MSKSQSRLAQTPWITSDLYKLIKTKNKLYRALIRGKFGNEQEYKRYKKWGKGKSPTRNQEKKVLSISVSWMWKWLCKNVEN